MAVEKKRKNLKRVKTCMEPNQHGGNKQKSKEEGGDGSTSGYRTAVNKGD